MLGVFSKKIKRIFISLLSVVVGVVFISCTQSSQSVSVVPLSINASIPSDNAKNVSINTTIVVTFSHELSEGTVSVNTTSNLCSGTFMVSTGNFTECISLKEISYSTDSKTVTVTPNSNLEYLTTYNIKLSQNIKDTRGQLLGSDTTFNFQTIMWDTDNDGIANSVDTDDDNDGVADSSDAFPLDSSESVDTDSDGIGNNTDTDDDGDGIADSSDVFPLDSSESVDTDSDGIGDNADTDDDNDGVADNSDCYPLDSTKTTSNSFSCKALSEEVSSLDTSLSLWLDASNINSNNNSGISSSASIDTWTDLSGNALYFSGDHFNVTPFPVENNYTEGELFIIIKTSETRQGHFHFWGNSGQNGHLPWSNGRIYEPFGRNSRFSFTPSVSLSNYFIYNLTAASTAHSVRINGGLEVTATGGSVEWGHSNVIGKSREGGFHGYIQELLFFKAVLSESERKKVNYYLSKKWDLTSNVDSDGDGTVDGSDTTPTGN